MNEEDPPRARPRGGGGGGEEKGLFKANAVNEKDPESSSGSHREASCAPNGG